MFEPPHPLREPVVDTAVMNYVVVRGGTQFHEVICYILPVPDFSCQQCSSLAVVTSWYPGELHIFQFCADVKVCLVNQRAVVRELPGPLHKLH